MENLIQFLKFFHVEKRRWILVVGLMAVTHFMCQSLLLPYGNALRSLLPGDELQLHTKNSFLSRSSNTDDSTLFVDMITDANKFGVGEESESNPVHAEELKGDNNSQSENVVDLYENSVSDDSKDLISDSEKAIISRHGLSLGQNLDLSNGSLVKNVLEEDTSLMPEENFPAEVTDGNADTNFPSVRDIDFDEFSASGNNSDSSFVSEKASRTEDSLSVEHIVKPSDGISKENIPEFTTSRPEKVETIRMVVPEIGSAFLNRSSSEAEAKALPKDESDWKLQRGFATLNNNLLLMNNTTKKLMRCDMPPKSVMPINEMNQLLLRHRRSSRAMRPRWSSIRDQEIVAAKLQIENAPIAKNDGALFSPLFRNVSKFKRSYELMEQTLKVYIYKEGEKPIFHQPILKGLYASEGWFMKLMVGNKQFAVKDPLKAHLFYMPFSSRMLEYTLYVRNSHNRTNLRQFLKQYSEKIAAKYRFWNRTGGADHFLVACHDWAPYETRHHMEHCIKALCNADVTAGFKIGRDISLPETYVRSSRNPLKDLGGNPPSKRSFLAFYAGNMHGYLRPILLKYWKDKDPGMKIYAPMPPGVASKMNYIQHMKSSKYCLCPKGYEVNSPRVVEAIFYECVPVIISDNFVPPFFEVLNWDAFSVIIAEKDIPNLKDILLAIPEEKYLSMQLAVRKVQKHFLWHAKPLKYDLFHMTLHSIWYNRVYQIKPR